MQGRWFTPNSDAGNAWFYNLRNLRIGQHWPPRLERAISILSDDVSPQVASRAVTALETILGWTGESDWHEVIWSFSRLTGDGFPVEFTLSSVDAGICYAAEVAAPEVPNVDRLARAVSLMECLGQPDTPADILDLLRQVQASGALSYGAWIAGRHHVDGDRYKIYAEVPRSGRYTTPSLFTHLLGSESLLNNRATQLRLIGYEPLTRRLELYFQVDELETWELSNLMNRVGLNRRLEELQNLLEDMCDRSVQETIPIANLGFSYSFSLSGEPAAFSLFTYARSVFGSDESIRRQLLSLGAKRGWDLRTYEKLSSPIASRPGRRTRHSLLSLVVPPKGALSVRVGMSPPIAPYDLD